MTGPDFLRWIVESGLSEHRERRSSAVRAFLRHQYDLDEEVRFKQVELQNKLLDLFVDVPITFREAPTEEKRLRMYFSRISELSKRQPVELHDAENEEPAWTARSPGGPPEREVVVEAATLLLNEATQSAAPRVVVEGAPGQGKSTIAQYVCQVHRMQLLENENLALLPVDHRQAPRRLPIRVDLRDLATWMGRRDPFNFEDQATPKNWHKSLEAFLAALISNQSGGTAFTTDDLLAMVRISAVLLLFDGLDEVADIARRQEIVDEIVKGVQRLESNAASLQVIVTSRPAAFANSPGMPHGQYLYLQLLSLTRPLIMRYADRWMNARHLDARQKAEFRGVLREKLGQPHLRDLARNPMQLAILLSLVLTRGASLPDKRTALYDYYIDLFVSREAEKSVIVRSHRELLVDIHRYLAWLLHSEAELGDARASIAQERLQRVVSDYLTREGHDVSLAKELFTGMVERVVALVSRVEGTFEFEVQPLREYFAACHLYYTAPQSSPGKERPGSKPDRFDAIARNFYWLNVTRFYAGCYSKGELPSLVERIQELKVEQGFRRIAHPRVLAATLLADWVFTQNPKSVRQVVELVVDGMGIRYLSQGNSRAYAHRRSTAGIVLPPKCGRDELVRYCFDILAADPPSDFEAEILDILRANTDTPSELMAPWAALYRKEKAAAGRFRWLKRGQQLRVLQALELPTLREFISTQRPTVAVLNILFEARRLDYVESSEQSFDDMVSAILDGEYDTYVHTKPESALDVLSRSVHPFRYSISFRDRQPISLEALLERREFSAQITLDPSLTTNAESFKNYRLCVEFARVAALESKRTAAEWATEIAPWDRLIEAGRSIWGDRWAFVLLANAASGIRSNSEKCLDCPELLDHARSLSRRARFARLRSGTASWWKKQFDAAQAFSDRMLVCLVALTWATTNTIGGLQDILEATLENLSQEQWAKVFYGARRSIAMARVGDERREQWRANALRSNLSIRMASVFAMRANDEEGRQLYTKYFESLDCDDPIALHFTQQGALDLPRFGMQAWSPNLDVISRCYGAGLSFEPYMYYQYPPREYEGMSIGLARAIIDRAEKLPGSLVRLAEEQCRKEVAAGITPVIRVAEHEGWFSS